MPSKKETLIEIVSQAKDEAVKVVEIGREMIGDAIFLLDLANCTIETIEALPNDETLSNQQWNQIIGSWQDSKNAADSIQTISFLSFSTNTSATGLTVSAVASSLKPYPSLNEPTSKVFQLVNRNASAYDIVADMDRLQLDSRGGDRQTAIQLFEQAKSALERPPFGEGSPVGILIALRGSIDAILDDLIKRRPLQEPGKKDTEKVVSIGKQCGRSGLSADHFTRLGDQLHDLRDELSGGKRESLSRPELTELFDRTSLFLKAFLGAIDETKLKKKA